MTEWKKIAEYPVQHRCADGEIRTGRVVVEKWTPQTMGQKGGKSRSPAKVEAARRNAKRAGRPRKPDDQVSPRTLARRRAERRKIDENPTGS